MEGRAIKLPPEVDRIFQELDEPLALPGVEPGSSAGCSPGIIELKWRIAIGELEKGERRVVEYLFRQGVAPTPEAMLILADMLAAGSDDDEVSGLNVSVAKRNRSRAAEQSEKDREIEFEVTLEGMKWERDRQGKYGRLSVDSAVQRVADRREVNETSIWRSLRRVRKSRDTQK